MPGLKVVAPSTPYDAKGLLKSAIRDDDPVIFFEGETLYGSKGEVPDEEYTVPIGVSEVKRPGTDVTVIAWSKMVTVALKAAESLAADGISCEVVDPRTLRPLDDAPILESVRKTNRCVILEEGWPYAGLGAQIAYQIHRDAFGDLDAPVTRVTGIDVPMPYAKNLEHMAMPSPARLIAAVREGAVSRLTRGSGLGARGSALGIRDLASGQRNGFFLLLASGFWLLASGF